jgi:hypothetical protein
MEKIKKIAKQILIIFVLLFLANCAVFDRGCSSCMASNFATDWVVVQYKIDGTPINCWKLTNVSIANEQFRWYLLEIPTGTFGTYLWLVQ